MINRRKFLATSAATGLAGCAELFGVRKSMLGQSSASASSTFQKYAQLLTSDRLRSRLYFIASDLFEGRRTGSPGQQLAASYLASEYAHMGFTSANRTAGSTLPESFLQRFSCYCKFPKTASLTMTLRTGNTLQSSSVGSNPQLYFAGADFRDLTAPLVFAGYGIEDPDKKYQDYGALRDRGIPIDGKWVMILEREPAFFSADGKPSKWSGLIAKRLAMMRPESRKAF